MKKGLLVFVFLTLSGIIFYLTTDAMLRKYEKKAEIELRATVKFTGKMVQDRLSPFIGTDSKDILNSITKEILREHSDILCIDVFDTLFRPLLNNDSSAYILDRDSMITAVINMSPVVVNKISGAYNLIHAYFPYKAIDNNTYITGIFMRVGFLKPVYSLKKYFNISFALFIFLEIVLALIISLYDRKLFAFKEKMAGMQQAILLEKLGGYLAHEIKNPLFIIRGNIEMSDIPQNQKEALLYEMDRIKSILERYETFTQARDEISYIALKEAMSHIEILFKNQFEKIGRNLFVDMPEGINITFHPSDFRQVCINLTLNGLDEAENLYIRAITKGKKVLIEFCSNGEPIDTKIARSMFSPYFTTKSTGTGLGLFISRYLAEKNGGKLYYLRKENKNCFILEVRVHEDFNN